MSRTIRMAGMGLVALIALNLTARSEDKPKSVEGAWRLVESKNGDATEYQKPADGTEMIDFIVGGRFVWNVVKDGKVLSLAGGRYKSEKDKFTEIIEYVSGDGVP